MLNTKNVQATIAVKNLKAAASFYGEKLGFKETEKEENIYIQYQSGETYFLVYQSEFAGGYKATVATFNSDNDTEKVVADLKLKGIKFEDYGDMPDSKHQGDLYVAGPMKMAWFKDPDGNILCVVGE